MNKIRSNTSNGWKAKEKIKTMHELLTSLKGKELIATEQQKILDHNFSGIAKKLIESHIANAKMQPNFNCYWDEVKQFAMTLHYYSPKAYELYARYWNCPTHQEFGTGLHLWTVSQGTSHISIKLTGLAAKTDHSLTDAVLCHSTPPSRSYIHMHHGSLLSEAVFDF